MKLGDVLQRLGEVEAYDAWASFWEPVQATLPTARPGFLQPAHLRAAWYYGGLEGPLPEAVITMADRITQDPALLRLAWFAHQTVFYTPREQVNLRWPALSRYLGDEAGLFYLTVGLAFIPAVRAYHAALGVPEDVTRNTCRQISCFLLNFRRGQGGRLGIYPDQFGWLNCYLAPNLYFRIGRFEYWRKPYPNEYRVYRHTASGMHVVLAHDQCIFTAAGDRCYDPPDEVPPGGWRVTFRETEAGVFGTPISPLGTAEPREVHLPADAWTCVLRKGDTILDMHIPAGGGMTPEACADSFRAAAAFFREHFPEPAARAICCRSWMFSNQLEECLPPAENLVALTREVYLFPVQARPNDGLWFVFLQKPFDPATAPRETRLQKAILDYLARGKTWHLGGMFLMLEDLPNFGTQVYRRQWAESLRERGPGSALSTAMDRGIA
jgi:hypothetical protein